MKHISDLTEAMKILNQNKKNQEALIKEKLDAMRNADLLASAMEDENLKKMVDDLDDHEKIEFDKEMSSITLSYSGILDALADYLEDPDQRKEIIEELMRRMS